MAKKNTGQQQRAEPSRGTYVGHVRGFGFFVPDRGGDDWFIPPGQEGDAIDGDTVLAERVRRDRARVVRVLERGRKLLAGTHLGRGSFAADAHRVPRILKADGKADKGDKVLVAATPGGFHIQSVLGRSGDPEVEDAAILAELAIGPEFPEDVLQEAGRLSAPTPADFSSRLDLRQAVTVVTIDPVTSRDFDDAISLERRGDEWVLGVHIADVSHYVRPGTALDREAHKRGTSVYLPNRVAPMLPEALSNDLCSLREGTDRLALSVQLRYDAKVRLKEAKFAETVIRSDRRFSYERASRIMDGNWRQSGSVGQVVRDMKTLAARLAEQRTALEIPREEIELVFSPSGDIVDVRSTAEDVAHGVIEEFMLAANREVARLMLSRAVPVLFRHHPAPESLDHVWETLGLLGIDDAAQLGLPAALATAVAKGFGPTAASAIFRCLPRALYTSADSTHYSLGFDAYTHFTSPIRRYTDLLLHRSLRDILRAAGGPVTLAADEPTRAPVADEALEKIGGHVNERASAADRAESRTRRRRVLEFLLRRGGSVPTDGQVTTVVEKGLVIDLPEYGIPGFLAAEALSGEPVTFSPGELRTPQGCYRLGDTLEVCIHRIDPGSGQLDLALAPKY